MGLPWHGRGLPNAKNPELRNMLVETRSAVAMHLKMAEQIKSSMP